jgi:hypothetical protein
MASPGGDVIAELGKLGSLEDAESTRLMGVVVALAAEVFVLKAQVERLTRALQAAGAVDAARLAAAGEGEDMKRWMMSEEAAFAGGLAAPYLEGDRALDSTRWMREK